MSDDSCIWCHAHVRPRQEAVECDICSRWQDRKCGNMVGTYVSVKHGKQLLPAVVTSIENNYFWIQYFKSAGKDKPDKWTMQPKLYTALVSDFVSILPPPDFVHESGTRFFYKFQIQ